jgi:deazaflavin-dependent oxidoreductase (nitroreductase family)
MLMAKFDDLPRDLRKHIAAHIKLYLEDPERAHMWDSSVVGVPGPVPTLLLTTRGRKSGEERHVPLLYVAHDDGWLIMGSKGGAEADPAWYLNLQAEPKCEIRVGKLHTAAIARTLQGEERERLWREVTERFPVYNKYQSRTERKIPLVLLERR